jgi:hypothetical protein
MVKEVLLMVVTRGQLSWKVSSTCGLMELLLLLPNLCAAARLWQDGGQSCSAV